MPARGNTFKIFCGNLSDRTTGEDLRRLFEQHGSVVEADVVKNFGFVHMETEEERKAAIEALNGHVLHDRAMSVEASTGSRKTGNQRTKIFIGNLHKDTKVEEVREMFEAYGKVVEADILTNYAFVHMEVESEAREAITSLDGTELHGLRLRVQESTSRVRQSAGMGNRDVCYRCGSGGHWSKECPRDGRGGPRGPDRGSRFSGRFDPYGPPPPAFARDRMMRGFRDEFDRYDRYDRFDRYDSPYDRRPLPPLRDDPYERRPLPPLRDDPYERRPLPPLPPARPDYLRYGRRSRSPPPSPRYPPPPPMRGYLPVDRRGPY